MDFRKLTTVCRDRSNANRIRTPFLGNVLIVAVICHLTHYHRTWDAYFTLQTELSIAQMSPHFVENCRHGVYLSTVPTATLLSVFMLKRRQPPNVAWVHSGSGQSS